MKRGVLLLTLGAASSRLRSPRRRFAGAVGPQSATASSHREAPLIGDDPTADNTDVYAFVSPDEPSTVTLIANYIPFEDPAGGPNYYPFDPNVLYELKSTTTATPTKTSSTSSGSRRRSRTTRHVPLQHRPAHSATDPDISVRQTYSVTRVLLDDGTSSRRA